MSLKLYLSLAAALTAAAAAAVLLARRRHLPAPSPNGHHPARPVRIESEA